MDEHNELKNRYMVIDDPTEWKQNRTSTEQVSNKYQTNTEQVITNDVTSNENIKLLIQTIGNESKPIKEILEAMGLKHRPTFLANYLKPAMDANMVQMLYPNQPKHPRQKYKLTVRGLTFFNELRKHKQ